MQYLAAGQIGQVRAAPFAESDQHASLPGDELHAESCLAAVTPYRCRQGFEHLLRLHVTDALQVVEQRLLPRTYLRAGLQVLQTAPATDTKMPAARRHPVRCRPVDIRDLSFIEVPVRRQVAEADLLPRQGTLDEHGLAGHVCNPAAVMCQ